MLSACTVTAMLSSCAATPDKYIVPLGSEVAGHNLETYANYWWQWAYSMSPANSAVRDSSGSLCHVNQSGDVWFLAGGYGTSLIQRSCTVPAGKYIFFPVINMVYGPPSRGQVTCRHVMDRAALNNDTLLAIDVELDGAYVSEPEKYRLKSPDCFDLAARIPPELGAAEVYPSAADGYWMMLKPLPPGPHSLKFRAIYNRADGGYGSMAQDIEYKLYVE